jgi:hypothetical protein
MRHNIGVKSRPDYLSFVLCAAPVKSEFLKSRNLKAVKPSGFRPYASRSDYRSRSVDYSRACESRQEPDQITVLGHHESESSSSSFKFHPPPQRSTASAGPQAPSTCPQTGNVANHDRRPQKPLVAVVGAVISFAFLPSSFEILG